MTTVTVGYNRRTWATFQVVGATPADDNPDRMSELADANVVDVTTDDDA